MDSILETMPCGFLAFTESGSVTQANATLHTMLGHTPGALHGRSIEKLLTVASRVFYQTHFFPLLKLQGTVDEIYLTLRSSDDSEVPVLVNAARREREGTTSYDCAIFPVRQRGLYEDEILSAKKAAEDAARSKDEFLAEVSHELRTPMSAILGWTRLMRAAKGDEALIERGIETIERNAEAQSHLVEDLIDVSRIVSGKLRLDFGVVELSDVVDAALDIVKPAAEAKGIRLQPILSSAAGPVSGDPARLQQVMWNLLSNAVKFTPRGGAVRLCVQRVNSSVEISVSDSGKGIPREFLPYVFERFHQAETGNVGRKSGLGLGMAITKEIVGLHGGTIRVDSEGEGKGATFTVTLPVLPVQANDERANIIPKELSDEEDSPDIRNILDGIHILLVDDARDCRDVTAAILTQSRARVTVAASAAEAFARIREAPPSILLSDIEMPGDDGHLLIRRVRSLPVEEGGMIPAIALTAKNRFSDRVRALAAGFQVHLAKPVHPEELVLVIASLSKT